MKLEFHIMVPYKSRTQMEKRKMRCLAGVSAVADVVNMQTYVTLLVTALRYSELSLFNILPMPIATT